MSRPGDWNCRSCHHLNFQRRDSCHRCGSRNMEREVTMEVLVGEEVVHHLDLLALM
ncbi:hypothetical protein CsSME_00046398 [Camellia sinensis var. sinensis]